MLSQPQLFGSVRPILFISRATLPNEVNWSPLEFEDGAVTWATKNRLRQNLFQVSFQVYTDHGALEQLAMVGEYDPRMQRWLQILTAYQYTVKHRPGKPMGMRTFSPSFRCLLRQWILAVLAG